MAILINKPITILGGMNIEQLYLRLFYNHEWDGKSISCLVQKYLSKEAYLNNINHSISIEGIDSQYFFRYDRQKDGIDILKFVHEKIKQILSTDKTQLVAEIDPDTGDIVFEENLIIDPSTKEEFLVKGDPIMVEEIVRPKFAETNQIQIIDLDPKI